MCEKLGFILLSKLPTYIFKYQKEVNLSVGQRQLLSFVRAMVFDPDILVLDEATSSIDNRTETTIQSAIEQLLANRTSITIAHRLEKKNDSKMPTFCLSSKTVKLKKLDPLPNFSQRKRQLFISSGAILPQLTNLKFFC